MGGLGSGRSGGRPRTEDGLPGCAWSGSVVWTDTRTSERGGSVSYQVYLGEESGRVRLKHTSTRADGEGYVSDYWVQLITTPQPFGGRRWWFVCPRTGKRAAKIYLPDEAVTFASRQAYRLTYACQREPVHYRDLRRALKLRGELGAVGGIGSYIPKPKWMRWPTYERAMTKIDKAEEVVDAHTARLLESSRKSWRRMEGV
jgi:hypothetical protein